MVEALVPSDVVVLKVDRPQLVIVPREAVTFAEPLQQAVLRDPIQLALKPERVVLERREHVLPTNQDLAVRLRIVDPLDVFLGVLEVLPLQLHGREPSSVCERDLDPASGVPGYIVQRLNGVLK